MNSDKDNKTLFVIVGAIILGVFIAISMMSMVGTGEYQLSTDIIKDIDYEDGKLVLTTRKDMVSVCVKQTKTSPSADSLCWIDTIDNKATISIYEYKTYYIWTKDVNDVISYYNKYNTEDNN